MISCRNLRLEYPDGLNKKVVLNDINLTINKGENVILLGPSGSGKSSLIYLLSSLRKPTGGEIIYDDFSLTSLNDKEASEIRRQHFGFIFQMHFLMPYLTVLENVMVGDGVFNKQNKERAEELLSQLGIIDHRDKKIYQMSGGQRQRVAIARALMNRPDIIFADEPTASLDHETALEVMSILKNHKKDSILIMATHDTSILSGDERIIKIIDGKTVE